MRALKENYKTDFKNLPPWFKQEIPDPKKTQYLKNLLNESKLNTVCQSALCPNLGKCWGKGVATFMILGDVCTRSCRFCAVKSGNPLPVDEGEPLNVAVTVKKLRLKYVVITSVTRDDLPDKGCNQFVETVLNIRNLTPETKIEVLIPDFDNEIDLLKRIAGVHPDVIGHNIETVKRIFFNVRPHADYTRSLSVLRNIKNLSSRSNIKSGFMVGLGETKSEVLDLMKDLFESGCEILTIGQYLSPSRSDRHLEVQRFISPEEFENYQEIGLEMGFKHVLSAPLVRSSYLAEEAFNEVNKSYFLTNKEA